MRVQAVRGEKMDKFDLISGKKTFALQKTPLRKWKDKPQIGRKYSQYK